MRKAFILPALLLTATACGQAEDPAANRTAPIPSGPPVPQQEEALQNGAAAASQPAAVPHWETVVTGVGMGLQWLDGGEQRLNIACVVDPVGLVVQAPGFKPIASEDRFMLGLGNEPVTLVADLAESGAAGGVVAEGPLPEGFDDLLRNAPQISALYGTQQVGPVPAPSDDLIDTFVKTCTGLRG